MWNSRGDLQVYACLAEKLPQEACQALLSTVLESAGEAAAEDDSAAWDTAEAMWVVEAATAIAHKTGGSAQLAGLLCSAMQRWVLKHASTPAMPS